MPGSLAGWVKPLAALTTGVQHYTQGHIPRVVGLIPTPVTPSFIDLGGMSAFRYPFSPFVFIQLSGCNFINKVHF